MRRRQFISLVGGAATWPFVAHSQSAMPTVGFLNATLAGEYGPFTTSFSNGLKEAGFIDGKNVTIEYRWAEGRYDRLPALAADLVQRRVSVIVTGGAPTALAAKAATTTIPVVFAIGADPVQLGLVAALNRPGGNVTGVTALSVELGPKRLELLHEIVPAATNIALLTNPTSPLAVNEAATMQVAARSLGLKLPEYRASTDHDLDLVFASLDELRPCALVVGPDRFFISHREQLAELATSHGVPAISQFREFAAAGGLMSYGGSVRDAFRLAGIQTGRILKGENPAELPVQQSTKLELVINLKTAKALGLVIPDKLLASPDQVIE
jgi:putative tryptophan/tyrosine transport system substrate-binding protein